LARTAWTITAALAGVLLLKTFVCDVKHVDSGSMAPTILGSAEGGESVLVLYGSFEPERFGFVVLTREGEAVPLVKRVVGLPTESVRIANGDLLIDGHRLPASAPRPPPILVFDDRRQRVADVFEAPKASEGSWRETAEGLSFDTAESGAEDSEVWMNYHRRLSDGFLDAEGKAVSGDFDVNDGIFECEVRPDRIAGRVLIELVEQGDTFRFVFEPKSSGTAEAAIVRRSAGAVDEVLARRVVPCVPGSWTALRCSNVDNALAFDISGSPEPLLAEYAENRFDESDRLREGKTFGPRVRFGGRGGGFDFRSIRILRDLYYTARGVHAVQAPADLGPGEYFVLGDRSAESRDSREWGPVRAERLLGRPVWVVWPLGSFRRLVPTVPAPGSR
jgi:signal peptidase I